MVDGTLAEGDRLLVRHVVLETAENKVWAKVGDAGKGSGANGCLGGERWGGGGWVGSNPHGALEQASKKAGASVSLRGAAVHGVCEEGGGKGVCTHQESRTPYAKVEPDPTEKYGILSDACSRVPSLST